MAKVVETRGSFRIKGKTNLDKAILKDLGWLQTANVTVKTLEDNFVNLTVEVKNGKGLNIRVKGKEDEYTREHPAIRAFDTIKETFSKEDMLSIVGVAGYNTKMKRFVLKPTGVFYSDSKYDDADFEETNFVTYDLIFDSISGSRAKMLHASYFGEITEIELTVADGLIEDFSSFRFGDLVRLVFSVVNRPIYASVSKNSSYQPKGRGVTQREKRTVEGYSSDLVVVGIIDVKSAEYTREDVRDAKIEYEKKQEAYREANMPTRGTADNEDELPY